MGLPLHAGCTRYGRLTAGCGWDAATRRPKHGVAASFPAFVCVTLSLLLCRHSWRSTELTCCLTRVPFVFPPFCCIVTFVCGQLAACSSAARSTHSNLSAALLLRTTTLHAQLPHYRF